MSQNQNQYKIFNFLSEYFRFLIKNIKTVSLNSKTWKITSRSTKPRQDPFPSPSKESIPHLSHSLKRLNTQMNPKRNSFQHEQMAINSLNRATNWSKDKLYDQNTLQSNHFKKFILTFPPSLNNWSDSSCTS